MLVNTLRQGPLDRVEIVEGWFPKTEVRVLTPTPEARERFWQDLITRLDGRIRAYLATFACGPDEIEDVVWDVWARASESEEAIITASDPWPRVHAALRSVCADHARASRRYRRSMLDVGIAQSIASTIAATDDPESEIGDWVFEALATLPEKQRLAVEYRHRWNWPYWAVAAAADLSEETARVYVHRGLAKLRTLDRARSKRS